MAAEARTRMASLGKLTLRGASTRKYQFEVYAHDSPWSGNLSCVYFVSRRRETREGAWIHHSIYVGEADDLASALGDHPKQDCFNEQEYNAISLLREADPEFRQGIVQDLVGELYPIGNR